MTRNLAFARPPVGFFDLSDSGLEMKIKKFMPVDVEPCRLAEWMEKGVHDAVQKKYLKMLLFCVCESNGGPMIEEYALSFSYSNAEGLKVWMNIGRTEHKKQGGSLKSNLTDEVIPKQMKSYDRNMMTTVAQLMRTVSEMPQEVDYFLVVPVGNCVSLDKELPQVIWISEESGKCVVYSEKKPTGVRKSFYAIEAKDVDAIGPQNKLNHVGLLLQSTDYSNPELSTYGMFHSTGRVGVNAQPDQNQNQIAPLYTEYGAWVSFEGGADGHANGGVPVPFYLPPGYVRLYIRVEQLICRGRDITPGYTWEDGEFRFVDYIRAADISTWPDVAHQVQVVLDGRFPDRIVTVILHYYMGYNREYYSQEGIRLTDGVAFPIPFLNQFVLPLLSKVRVYMYP